MAQGDAQAAAIRRRIQVSTKTLVLVFPPPRTAAVVTGPGTRPTSPMSGTKVQPTLVVPEPADPEYPPLELQCLWSESPLAENAGGAHVSTRGVGWVSGATALSRVLIEDAWFDANATELGTWFDKAVYVTHRGLNWRVVKTEPMGPAFGEPHSLSIWLTGAGRA